jgi:mevalonate kinase
MYLGAGLGSSAAVTVATLKAVSMYANQELDLKSIAKIARDIEIKIQGAASPIDTAMSTYGGIIYIDENSELNKIDFDMQLPLIVSNCELTGNTGKLVESVREKYEKYPEIIGNIFKSMEQISVDAKKALENGDSELIGNLMNINQGLLDAIGVNTEELSEMVYQSRKFGSVGSKLTGSGGGGCIIAYAPHNIEFIYENLSKHYKTFKCEQSNKGVQAEIIN